jgi:hypothetical protein
MSSCRSALCKEQTVCTNFSNSQCVLKPVTAGRVYHVVRIHRFIMACSDWLEVFILCSLCVLVYREAVVHSLHSFTHFHKIHWAFGSIFRSAMCCSSLCKNICLWRAGPLCFSLCMSILTSYRSNFTTLMFIFWVVSPYKVVGRCQCFGGIYWLYLQGWSFVLAELHTLIHNVKFNFVIYH